MNNDPTSESTALTVTAAQHVVDNSSFGAWWRFEVVDVGFGSATVRLGSRPELFRPGGVLHGGCAMTLADVAFWIALLSRDGIDDPAVTFEMKTNFLRGAATDLHSTARVLSTTRRICYGEASTHDDNGSLVAHHTLTYMRPT